MKKRRRLFETEPGVYCNFEAYADGVACAAILKAKKVWMYRPEKVEVHTKIFFVWYTPGRGKFIFKKK